MAYQRLTIDKLNNDGCLNLLATFLEELAKEFCSAYIHHIKEPNDKDRAEHYKNIKKFINSKYFERLTGLTSKDIVENLEYKCRTEWRLDYGKVLQAYQYQYKLHRDLDKSGHNSINGI